MSLNWIYIAISWILLRWHDLWSAVMGPTSDFAWVISIMFLVITIRAVLFPVFVKQIKSQRAMQALQPQVKALQEKHKGDRESLQKEVMELYRKEKANPLMGCLPMVLQIPVFIGLFHVLRQINPLDNKAMTAMTTEYGWSTEQFHSVANAKLFGAPLASAFSSSTDLLNQLDASQLTVRIVAGVLIAIMVSTTYITQRQMIARTGKNADPTQAMIQKFMLYGIPISLLVSGSIFPIGVVIYWVTNNLFSMGQQFWVLRNMPPPVSALGAKDNTKGKEISAETAKALAPKPGVKPVNPKKGGRTTTQDAQEVNLSKDSAASDSESTSLKKSPASGAPKPSVNGKEGSEVRGSSDNKATAGASSSNTGARRPQSPRNRKRKGGRR